MTCVILPVKGFDAAKSRIEQVPVEARADLARAMFLDVLTAAQGTSADRVVVVSDSEEVLEHARIHGAEALYSAQRLNEAIALAQDDGPSLVVVSDLPASTTGQIQFAMDATITGGDLFVPDMTGTGTTVLGGHRPKPRFGPDSAEAHRRTGARQLDMPACGLRQDIDSLDDLRAARRFGVGNNTELWWQTYRTRQWAELP